jgi:hypothetical protein
VAALNGPTDFIPKNVATFNESLAFLRQRKVGELDQALRTTLDVAASRLDAWITSLATKRLDQMREKAPAGLHLGAFGVVENLVPDSRLPDQRLADSLGYVHAPSLHQATTAAVLRSGHLANREAAAGSTSTCVRTASSGPSVCSKALPTGSRWRPCWVTGSSARCATTRCRSTSSTTGVPSR